MNLVVDESVERSIVVRLREDGHDVLYIAEMDPGVTDDQVLDRANECSALLLTEDKDFGEIVFRQGSIHNGVVLIRLDGLSSGAKASTVSEAFREFSDEMPGGFTVVSPDRIRIRKNAGKLYIFHPIS